MKSKFLEQLVFGIWFGFLVKMVFDFEKTVSFDKFDAQAETPVKKGNRDSGRFYSKLTNYPLCPVIKPKNRKPLTFPEAAAPILLIPQFFSQLPVINITSKDPSKFKFSWGAPRTIYTLVFIILEFFEILLTVHRAFTYGMSITYAGMIRYLYLSYWS